MTLYEFVLITLIIWATACRAIPQPLTNSNPESVDESSDPKWLVALIQNNTKDGLLQLPPHLASKVPAQFSQYVNNPKQARIPDFILKNTPLLTKVVSDVIKQNPVKVTTVPTTTVATTTTIRATTVTTKAPVPNFSLPSKPITAYIRNSKKDLVLNTDKSINIGSIFHPSSIDFKGYFGSISNPDSAVTTANPEYGYDFFDSIRHVIENESKPTQKVPPSPRYPYYMTMPPPIYVVVNGTKVRALPYPFPYPPPNMKPLNGGALKSGGGGGHFLPFPFPPPMPIPASHHTHNKGPFRLPPCFKLENSKFIPC